ncbi:MAG: aldo/keto reductase [Paludibacteraceae bacterium]|nr:aldo/keto reductase [Paludibacteraceae bacterium]
MKNLTLSEGIQMPILGYGVYRVSPDECEQCVADALRTGFRHIDTAQAYFNEQQVGDAIRKSGIPRDEIFITSKVWIDHFGYEETRASVMESLRKLQTTYIDLMLLHQPFGDAYGAWRALEQLVQEGKIRAIGVSNFYADRLVEFCNFACNDFTAPDGTHVKGVRPAVNQVEIHPYHQQTELLGWMKKYDVLPEAWAPLGEGRDGLFDDPVLQQIAQQHGKSLHQVVLRWHIQRGVAVFPMSRNKQHMADNMNVFDFELTEAEMQQIAQLDKHRSAFFSHRDPAMVEWFAQMVEVRRNPNHNPDDEKRP